MTTGGWLRTGNRLAIGMLIWLLLVVATRADQRVEAGAEDWGASAARSALRQGNYPWYDSESDDLRAVNVSPRVPPSEAVDWKLNPPDWEPNVPNWNLRLDFWKFVQWLVWGLLIGCLIGLLLYFIRSTLRGDAFAFASAQRDVADQRASEAAQIAKLPFPVERPTADLLGTAQAYYQQGDFAAAVIYLFSYQLVHLDKHQLIRLAKGKTNRQYLRELGEPDRSLSRMLGSTMVLFEKVFFGNHSLDRSTFESCWRKLDEFHQQVQRRVPAATQRSS